MDYVGRKSAMEDIPKNVNGLIADMAVLDMIVNTFTTLLQWMMGLNVLDVLINGRTGTA